MISPTVPYIESKPSWVSHILSHARTNTLVHRYTDAPISKIKIRYHLTLNRSQTFGKVARSGIIRSSINLHAAPSKCIRLWSTCIRPPGHSQNCKLESTCNASCGIVPVLSVTVSEDTLVEAPVLVPHRQTLQT